MSVGWESTWTRAEYDAPPRLVVELDDSLGNHKRVVIWEGNDARAQHDAVRAFSDGGKEEFRGGDHLPASGVVFAAPELVVPEVVEELSELQVALELNERVFADGMMRR